MRKRYQVRPSRSASLAGLIGGVMFAVLGLVFVIPMFGPFGVVWTLIAVVIAGFHFYNLRSGKGSGLYSIEVEDGFYESANSGTAADFDIKLRKLKKLYEDGVITRKEYDQKRQEILSSKW